MLAESVFVWTLSDVMSIIVIVVILVVAGGALLLDKIAAWRKRKS